MKNVAAEVADNLHWEMRDFL